MLKPVLLISLSLIYFHRAPAQEQARFNSDHHLLFITTTDNSKIKGWLYNAGEDSLYFLPATRRSLSFFSHRPPSLLHFPVTIDASAIKQIKWYRKKNTAKWTVLGALGGGLTGVIMGLAEGDDEIIPYTGGWADLFIALSNSIAMTSGEKALFYGITLSITGAATGYFFSHILKKKIVLKGNKGKYQELRGELLKRSLIIQP
ncbi:MAG TPA: hypothetical protein PKC69_00120 [Chitinophagaceae bacterium]|nr:hypothetical protein [Chitinophagaceae bacterium]